MWKKKPNFRNFAQCKQSPNGRNFAQSGHPGATPQLNLFQNRPQKIFKYSPERANLFLE
jgi:hypothetical protein